MSDVPFNRSIYARLVLWAIAVSITVTLLLWAVTEATIERSGRAALSRAVDVDLAGLADIFASGGPTELQRRIADRLALASADGNAPHYMLAADDGRKLAGDVERWPALSPLLSQSGKVALANGQPVFARATQLGPGLRLLVAREYGHDSELLGQVRLAFLAAGAFLAATVGLAGMWLARRLAGRIDRINRAFREQDEPSLDALSDGRSARDEIGELTRHSAEALDRLKRLVVTHRETSDQIAHELRTPLMHLDTRLVRALKAAPDDAARTTLADARTEIRHIVALLESLLDIATSEARRGDRRGLSPVNLSLLAERIGDLYADSAEESGHRFVVAIEPGVTLDGEEMQLTRLITNLLDNAFKYVPAGCTVKLAVEHGPRLTVSDDGPGIAPDDRARIFDRFQRGARSPGEGQGAGLGLALAKAIAGRHGLGLSLAPTESGATFVLSPEGIT
ncbi:MAG: HAMP domain-containing histidine kinase [Sphingomonadales bacterium]|nr:HAMP domain-containing histidine kinase [Sphingomonadales bacterium]